MIDFKAKDKYDYYTKLSNVLITNGFECSTTKDINYGVQFSIKIGNLSGTIRIYESKKGIKPDFSPIKNEELKQKIESVLNLNLINITTKSTIKNDHDDPVRLIGTDESGKGDFFGPLVTAAVYTDEKTSQILRILGVQDSKKITDKLALELSEKIKQTCPYSVVIVKNEKYNQLYENIKNLNKLLAWTHAKAIENMLDKTECRDVLADKFGDEKLIKNALSDKCKEIKLSQRTKAEANISVAAASIIARAEFVKALDDYEQQYGLKFNKGGASPHVINTGKSFITKYGEDQLYKVAKMHFKTLENIVGG